MAEQKNERKSQEKEKRSAAHFLVIELKQSTDFTEDQLKQAFAACKAMYGNDPKNKDGFRGLHFVLERIDSKVTDPADRAIWRKAVLEFIRNKAYSAPEKWYGGILWDEAARQILEPTFPDAHPLEQTVAHIFGDAK